MSSSPDLPESSTKKDNAQIINELSNKISIAAEAGDFEAAKRLRDKLIETDPMAIGEAIKTAELIEKQMSAAIDKDHLTIWPDLYDQLTIEEQNCLFHSMKKYVLPEKTMLLKYGSLNNRLFFIEKGRVTVGLPQEANKIKVLAQLGRADILGEYTFATIALCSATAITKTKVQLRCLEGQIVESWEDNYPVLYSKILGYCNKYGRIDQIVERKKRENHKYHRYPVQGRVKAVLLDNGEQKPKVAFKGKLVEISRSGTSFSIHCNRKAIVKQLLARSFSLAFTFGKKGKEISFSCIGRVVCVSSLLYNDYVLHIGFHDTLSAELERKLEP